MFSNQIKIQESHYKNWIQLKQQNKDANEVNSGVQLSNSSTVSGIQVNIH